MLDITNDIQSLTTFRRRSGDFMKQLIESMKRHDLRTAPDAAQQPVTYARSLRAAALAD